MAGPQVAQCAADADCLAPDLSRVRRLRSRLGRPWRSAPGERSQSMKQESLTTLAPGSPPVATELERGPTDGMRQVGRPLHGRPCADDRG